ncbi:MAG TPA: hypothetical protein VGJ20_28420, partial [Xanthobacteraceae bacterium]
MGLLDLALSSFRAPAASHIKIAYWAIIPRPAKTPVDSTWPKGFRHVERHTNNRSGSAVKTHHKPPRLSDAFTIIAVCKI